MENTTTTVNFNVTVYESKMYSKNILKLFLWSRTKIKIHFFVHGRSWISIQELCVCIRIEFGPQNW